MRLVKCTFNAKPSGPNFLAMEVGPLWLFLSYVAVAGFTHLVSTGLHSSHDHKKQAQLPPSTEFMQSTVETAPCGLMDFFNKHKEGPGIDKWVHYFPIYEEHFGRFCQGKGNLSMAEIGVQSGGSLLMWRHAFGKKLQLMLGLDIDNNTKAWEKLGSNIKIEIGNQGDAEFLRSVKTKYPGGFDILLDDGSHLPEHQFTTFVHLWSAIRPGGVLMIEDVHGINPMFKWLMEGHMNENAKMPGLYYPRGRLGPTNDVSRAGGDFLNNFGGKLGVASRIQNEVESVKIYPFIVAITKRRTPLQRLTPVRRGSQWIAYSDVVKEEYETSADQ